MPGFAATILVRICMSIPNQSASWQTPS